MHNLALLLSKFSLQVKTSYQIAGECTIYRPCFQNVLGIAKICAAFSTIVLKSVKMHAEASLFQNDLYSFNSFQMPSEGTIYRPCFQHFLCSSKSFRMLSDAPFSILNLFSIFSRKFQIV